MSILIGACSYGFMLNRETCRKCVNLRDKNSPWHVRDNLDWEKSELLFRCNLQIVVFVKGSVPEKCPYKEEHEIAVRKKDAITS